MTSVRCVPLENLFEELTCRPAGSRGEGESPCSEGEGAAEGEADSDGDHQRGHGASADAACERGCEHGQRRRGVLRKERRAPSGFERP